MNALIKEKQVRTVVIHDETVPNGWITSVYHRVGKNKWRVQEETTGDAELPLVAYGEPELTTSKMWAEVGERVSQSECPLHEVEVWKKKFKVVYYLPPTSAQ